jgi:hypothetical protein
VRGASIQRHVHAGTGGSLPDTRRRQVRNKAGLEPPYPSRCLTTDGDQETEAAVPVLQGAVCGNDGTAVLFPLVCALRDAATTAWAHGERGSVLGARQTTC